MRRRARSHADLLALLIRTFANSLLMAAGLRFWPRGARVMRGGAIDGFGSSGNRASPPDLSPRSTLATRWSKTRGHDPFPALGYFCLAACLPLATAHAGEFTPAQRAEIVQIMRDALKQDPSILRDAVNAMQADDGDRQQAAARAAIAAARGKLVNPADPVAGDPGGDVTIVEFFDTRCPYCRKLEPTMSDLLARDHRRAAGLQGSADPGSG